MTPQPATRTAFGGPPLCPSCGSELTTAHERHENICGALACRGPWLQQQIAEQKRKEKAAQASIDDGGREYLQQKFPELHEKTLSGKSLLIVVPAIDYDQAPQPAERVAAFRRVLEEACVEADQLANHPLRRNRLLSGYEPRDKDCDSRAVINACSTCRGWCCRMGHQHAYLSPEFLAWRFVQDESLTSEAMIDDYIDRIPEKSQNDSCLYHTEMGCALPREIRSSTCNDFLCPGLRQHKASIDQDPHQPTVVVAFDGEEYLRAADMDAAGNRNQLDGD